MHRGRQARPAPRRIPKAAAYSDGHRDIIAPMSVSQEPASSAQAEPPEVAAALARNDRYLREFIESLGICPYARVCRETGRLHREVVLDRELDAAGVAARVRALEALSHVEVALLIFPCLTIEARPFERFITEVRAAYEKGRDPVRGGPPGYFVVAFHPELPMQLHNPDVAVRFMRRSPDPTIQLVRPDAIERVQRASREPETLSRLIAEAGLRAVQSSGVEQTAALLADMRPRAPLPPSPPSDAPAAPGVTAVEDPP